MSQSLPNGTILGEYTLIRLIGRGGMGEVYEAYESKLHRRVALKIIAPLQPDEHDYEDLFRRFLQEARTLAQVNHPNIVTIYDIDRAQGAQFIAMEFVAGLSLKQVLKEVSLSLDEAIPIFAQLLDGLTCLHDNHIIHRDLKPHNILLRTDGQIKILDFGIAKQVLPGKDDGTQVGVIAGTLPYMAPEIKIGDPASAASDIYALGAIFYELIVGRALARVLLDHPNTFEVPWSREDMTRIPHGMRNIISRMCAYNAKERYQNTFEVSEDLKRFRQSRAAAAPEVYDAMVKKVAAIAELKRKEITSEFSFTSLKNNSPMPTELRSPGPDRRKSKRKAQDSTLESLMPYAAMAGIVIAGFGTWFALKTPSSHLAPAPQPVIPPQVVTAHPKTESLQPPLILLEPKDNDTLWLEIGRVPTLTWSRALNANEYDIQIASDTRFKKILISEPVAGNNFRPSAVLPEGKYYWRLEPKVPTAPAAGPFRFSVASLSPIELVSPNSNHSQELKGSESATELILAWKCKAGAKFYRVQISPEADFKNIQKEQLLQSCQYQTGRLAAGTYHWRVRMEDAAPAQSPWSEARSFAIRAASVPAPPVAARPSRGFESAEPKLKKSLSNFTLEYHGTPRDLASLHKNLVGAPRLEWQPLKGARSYQVQLSFSKDFSSVLHEEKTNAPSLDWRSAVPGKVFWRVRGIDAAGEFSDYSARAMVIVMLPPPQLKDSYKLVREGGSKGADPVWEWDPMPLANKYLVQQGATRSLASAEEKLVEEPRVEIEGQPGKYFVRVAAANDAGEAISQYSKLAALTVEGFDLSPPKTQLPGQGARAPSRDGRLSVKFAWTPVAQAEIYAVELAADPEFNQIIQKLRTPQSTFLLKQAQLKGRVFWRVRAESTKGNSEWSASSYFDVR